MIFLVKLLGIAIAIMGITFLVRPKTVNQYLLYWKKNKNMKTGGIISFVFGIICLIAAPDCKVTWFITLLGILSIVKGVSLLAIKQEKLSAYLDWFTNKSIAFTRGISIYALVFGIIIIYCA